MGRKKTEEVISKEVSPSTETENKDNNTPIYVPDIPAQIEEIESNDNVDEIEEFTIGEPIIGSPIESEKKHSSSETEIDFLNRLKEFQRNGGWGRHLEPMINERIEFLKHSN